ncbi:MAG TPA: Mur ligase family protein, partial [Chitinophagales bacterium]|nr:Mur ligase family protein [Chitinophagales bacterium]
MVDLSAIYTIYLKLGRVSTDTRKVKPADMFFALKGPNFNGNDFVQQAFDAGASYCVVDEERAVIRKKHCILVKDALQTLQDLAVYHRKQLPIPVVAVAGSNGKTTTKELVGAVLNKRLKTFHTEGNLNNHIGVPLSILSIKPDVEIAVLELGANHLHETERLCRFAMPTHGLVTNNGKDHLEGYGSLENVRKGNGELYEYLRTKGGIAFVSNLQPDLLEDSSPMKRFTYGKDGADVVGRVVEAAPLLKFRFREEKEKGYDVETNLAGAYNFENAMAA